jgi:hypothetical protein
MKWRYHRQYYQTNVMEDFKKIKYLSYSSENDRLSHKLIDIVSEARDHVATAGRDGGGEPVSDEDRRIRVVFVAIS